jgi:DNA adenine methylase
VADREARTLTYPGGKAGAGVYQTIINAMPPHDCYIEAFVGGGAILQRKKPARSSIVIDADAEVAARWAAIAKRGAYPGLRSLHGDARSLIVSLDEAAGPFTLIYCDPPYVRSTRRSRRAMYRHEMTEGDHRRLLAVLVQLRCAVMVSGYRHAIYDKALRHWNRIDFTAATRGGPAIESLWLNYDQADLHDYQYVGRNFRDRQRLKRKKERWCARIAQMPLIERRALMAALLDQSSSQPTMEAFARRASSGLTMRTCTDPLVISDDAGSRSAGTDDGRPQASGPEKGGP